MKKVIIIGSGPAGITAGIYLTRAKIENIVITNNQGALKKAELIENYYGFENPISGDQLLENGVKILFNTTVSDLVVDDNIIKGVKIRPAKFAEQEDYDNDETISGDQAEQPGLHPLLPPGRLLRDVQRGCPHRFP